MSNVTGYIPDIATIRKAHKGLLIIDACQLIAHKPVDVNKLGCDALAFSAHKIYGPLGIGVLYVKKEVQELMKPFLLGGGMVADAATRTWAKGPQRFEAGTIDGAGIVATAQATTFITKQYENIQQLDTQLTPQYIELLKEAKLDVLNEGEGIISFYKEELSALDLATILGEKGICVRSGHHCAQPLLRHLHIANTVRISLGAYNSEKELTRFKQALQETLQLLRGKK
jgi:cysteine desulfurase/selenocysteine lyase